MSEVSGVLPQSIFKPWWKIRGRYYNKQNTTCGVGDVQSHDHLLEFYLFSVVATLFHWMGFFFICRKTFLFTIVVLFNLLFSWYLKVNYYHCQELCFVYRNTCDGGGQGLKKCRPPWLADKEIFRFWIV